MAGDVEGAAQLIMHRYEAGQNLKPSDRKVGRPGNEGDLYQRTELLSPGGEDDSPRGGRRESRQGPDHREVRLRGPGRGRPLPSPHHQETGKTVTEEK